MSHSKYFPLMCEDVPSKLPLLQRLNEFMFEIITSDNPHTKLYENNRCYMGEPVFSLQNIPGLNFYRQIDLAMKRVRKTGDTTLKSGHNTHKISFQTITTAKAGR